MKVQLRYLLTVVLVVPLVLTGVVAAQDTTQVETQTTVEQNEESTDNKPELTAEQQAKLKARLDSRKAQLKPRITNAEKLRLQTRCKNSTGKLNSLSGRIKGIETSRGEKYSNLTSRLENLVVKLKEKEVETADLEAQITTLNGKIDIFKTGLAEYKQAVSDLHDMDCAADGEAFKASLEAARTLREQVYTNGKDIKAYLKETIKPTLTALRSQVDTESEENN